MKVKLIQHTKDADKICALAALGCHEQKAAFELEEDITLSSIEHILRYTISKGHESVIEHASFTFSIKGVSRSLSHQLVRHRIASFSQQSQRFVKMEEPEFVTPHTIAENKAIVDKYEKIMEQIWSVYNEFIKEGIPVEDARFVLPNACKTNIVVTMNARELHHFFELRCCEKAQWEIRELAREMLKLVKKVAPLIFEKAGPDCLNCPEKDPKCQRKHI